MTNTTAPAEFVVFAAKLAADGKRLFLDAPGGARLFYQTETGEDVCALKCADTIEAYALLRVNRAAWDALEPRREPIWPGHTPHTYEQLQRWNNAFAVLRERSKGLFDD